MSGLRHSFYSAFCSTPSLWPHGSDGESGRLASHGRRQQPYASASRKRERLVRPKAAILRRRATAERSRRRLRKPSRLIEGLATTPAAVLQRRVDGAPSCALPALGQLTVSLHPPKARRHESDVRGRRGASRQTNEAWRSETAVDTPHDGRGRGGDTARTMHNENPQHTHTHMRP